MVFSLPQGLTTFFFNVSYDGWVLSVAKGPTNTPLNYFKTSESGLSNDVLFISIRQIFDYISASENKVSEATFSEFSEISRKPTNLPEAKNVLEK